MPRSFLVRVWDAVKPPPPLPARRRLNRSQRRLLRVTAIVIALGASGWSIYAWIASAPNRALGHNIEGSRMFSAGNFQGAAAQFTDAIKTWPEYADAYVGRGKAEVALGQTETAMTDFGKAMAIDPTLEQPHTLHANETAAPLDRAQIGNEREVRCGEEDREESRDGGTNAYFCEIGPEKPPAADAPNQH